MKVPKILENSAIYSIIQFLQKGISFLLLPLYTAYLSPSDYGVMNVVTSVSSLISLLILMGLQGAGTRFYYQNKNDKEYNCRLWGTLVTFVICSSIVVFVITICFHKFIIDPLIGEISFFPYIFLGLLNVLVTPLYIFFQSYLQSRQEGLHYGLNTFINFITNVALIILFVVCLKLSVLGVLLANLITSILFFFYVALVFIPKIKLGFDKDILKPALKYSLPLVPHLLAGWSTGMIDRLLINGMRSEKETGLYSVASQFGSIVNTIANAMNMAYLPWFYEKFESKDFNAIKKVGLLMIYVLSILACMISLFSPEVLQFMVADGFRDVWTIIPLLSFAYVFQGLYYLYINVLFLKKTDVVFVVSITTLALSIFLNVLLIPKLGYLGSALACIVAYSVKSILAFIISRRVNKDIRFFSIQSYLFILLMFSVTFINYPLRSLPLLLSLGIKLTICMLVIAFVFFKYRSNIQIIKDSLFHKK